MQASSSHLVMIPSYNPGPKVDATVREARAQWNPVWVVIDGSTDGSMERLSAMAAADPGLRIIALPENRGKGAAVLEGLRAAAAAGFTHVLTMDSDGQHPAHCIPEFMQVSTRNPGCMVLGKPVFDAAAPQLRVKGREISNWWANLETLWMGIGDSLFGFRVYPIAPLERIMQAALDAALRLRPRGGGAPVPGPGCARSTCLPRCATSAATRAGCRTSAIFATTACSPGCIPGCSSAFCCVCRASSCAACASDERPAGPGQRMAGPMRAASGAAPGGDHGTDDGHQHQHQNMSWEMTPRS
jgi:hypothetical protein